MNAGILTPARQFATLPRGLLGRPSPVPTIDARRVFDPDAERYIAAVELADQQSLEEGVRVAIGEFVIGCKEDNTWNALRASCILMGARTLSGALTPLVGSAPTNNNFVSGDYNRKTGLAGNGSTKWLNSNRNNNADGQDDFHLACYASSAGTSVSRTYMGAGAATNESGASNFGINTLTTSFFRCRLANTSSGGTAKLLVGVSRAASGSYTQRVNGTDSTITSTSQTPTDANIGVFAATNGAYATNARFAFYSIGTALTLSTLETRITTLYNAIGAAIA